MHLFVYLLRENVCPFSLPFAAAYDWGTSSTNLLTFLEDILSTPLFGKKSYENDLFNK